MKTIWYTYQKSENVLLFNSVTSLQESHLRKYQNCHRRHIQKDVHLNSMRNRKKLDSNLVPFAIQNNTESNSMLPKPSRRLDVPQSEESEWV